MKKAAPPYRNRIELLQGTLDMLILQTLQRGPQHGYAITQALRARSSEVLQVETGSLYPALHRLERQGFVSAKWGETEQKQRGKFYSITAAGRRQLASDRSSKWDAMVAAITSVFNSGKPKAEAAKTENPRVVSEPHLPATNRARPISTPNCVRTLRWLSPTALRKVNLPRKRVPQRSASSAICRSLKM